MKTNQVDRSILTLRIPHVAGCENCHTLATQVADPTTYMVWGYALRDPNATELSQFNDSVRVACADHTQERNDLTPCENCGVLGYASDRIASNRIETHPIIDALSAIVTYRTHLDRPVLDHAESWLGDLELSDDDRRVLVEMRTQITELLNVSPKGVRA